MRTYACIDLKSFYASCECVERGLDPLKTNLVVADKTRTEKTICLAVTPSLKSFGLSGRSRLYEVVQKVKEVNELRKKNNSGILNGKSFDIDEINSNKDLELDYIVAPPRMALYMKYSTRIYDIYLKYISKDDIFAYSIDEVFCDITDYLNIYKKTAIEFITMIINDVYKTTGITATAGIGTNLYLAKIAMDIVAKHAKPNKDGARLAYLNENLYRKVLWIHEPITDFWRIGKGTANRLKEHGMYTMGDVARKSLENEDLLFKIFGINAELLIDHSWGYEPCTIKDVKNYKPSSNSISEGQVLQEAYDYKKAKIVIREMTENLSLSLVNKGYVTDHIALNIIYDVENIKNPKYKRLYSGDIVLDYYGRKMPKPSHSTLKLDHKTSSSKILIDNVVKLYDKIVNPLLLIRKLNVAFFNLENKEKIKEKKQFQQLDLFDSKPKIDTVKEEKDNTIQKTIIEIKNKYGKNAILKAMDLEDGATSIMRNKQIGGHNSE